MLRWPSVPDAGPTFNPTLAQRLVATGIPMESVIYHICGWCRNIMTSREIAPVDFKQQSHRQRR